MSFNQIPNKSNTVDTQSIYQTEKEKPKSDEKNKTTLLFEAVCKGDEKESPALQDFEITESFISSLPEELIQRIFEQLDFKSLVQAGRACTDFHRLASDPQIFKSLLFNFVLNQALTLTKQLPSKEKTDALYEIFWSLIAIKNLTKAIEVSHEIEDERDRANALCTIAELKAEQNCGTEEELLLKEVNCDKIESESQKPFLIKKIRSLLIIAEFQASKNPQLASKALAEVQELIFVIERIAPESTPHFYIPRFKIQCKINLHEAKKMLDLLPSDLKPRARSIILETEATVDLHEAKIQAEKEFEGLDQFFAYLTLAEAQLQTKPEKALTTLSKAESLLSTLEVDEDLTGVPRTKISVLAARVNLERGLELANLLGHERPLAIINIAEELISKQKNTQAIQLFKEVFLSQNQALIKQLIPLLIKIIDEPEAKKLLIEIINQVKFSSFLGYDFPNDLDDDLYQIMLAGIDKLNLEMGKHIASISQFNPTLALDKVLESEDREKLLSENSGYLYKEIISQMAKRDTIAAIKTLNVLLKNDFQKALAYCEILKLPITVE